MKQIYFSLIAIIMIMFTSCSNDEFDDLSMTQDDNESVAVHISYNLSSKSLYSSCMTRATSYTDTGDSVWINVFKPAIEKGILVDSTMNITFTSLQNGLTTKISGKYGNPLILKKGKYAVKGTIGLEDGGKSIYQFGSLELKDTIYVTEQNENISIKATVEYQSLIISPNKFTVYYNQPVYKYKNYYYIFVDTYNSNYSKNDYYDYTFVFDAISYNFKPTHNSFYYYGESTNTTSYDVDMNNGHK